MEALFGILHLDGRPADVAELHCISASTGAGPAEVAVDGAFCLALSRSVLDPAAQSAGIARALQLPLWAAMTGDLDNRAELGREVTGGDGAWAERDAEIVLALYLARGPAFAERLEGFFNLVVWDSRQQRLLLCADRSGGLRALYHARLRDTLVFGSTAKAVLAYPGVVCAVDRRGLDEALTLGHAIAPRTPFAGVEVLPGGALLECRDGTASVRRYCRPAAPMVSGDRPEVLRERYLGALESAVARALDARAEVGVLLSGGVDSAALVSLVHRTGRRRFRTFSIHSGDEERAAAASTRVAALFSTDHRAVLDLDERCLDELPRMIWHYEAPAQSIHPTYWLCQAARRDCDLVIGGYGNDGVWGLFPPKRWLAGLPAPLVAAACRARYLRWRTVVSRRVLRRLLAGTPATSLGVRRAVRAACECSGDQFDDMNVLDDTLCGDQRVYRELGKLALGAASLHVRLPYEDAEVRRVAQSIPRELRMGRAGDAGTVLKGFFKDIIRHHGLLPPDIVDQEKAWMCPPTARWLRGPLGDTVAGLLSDRRTRARGQIRCGAALTALSEHRAGVADHSVALMSLVALELWQRLFIDPAVIARPDAPLAAYVEGQPGSMPGPRSHRGAREGDTR